MYVLRNLIGGSLYRNISGNNMILKRYDVKMNETKNFSQEECLFSVYSVLLLELAQYSTYSFALKRSLVCMAHLVVSRRTT